MWDRKSPHRGHTYPISLPGHLCRARLDASAGVEPAGLTTSNGDDAKVTVGLVSSVLTDEHLAEHAWRALNDYLDENWVLKFLLASKIASPLRFRTQSEKSVLELLGNDMDSLKVSRLQLRGRTVQARGGSLL